MSSRRIGLLVNPTAGKNAGARVGTTVADLLERGGAEVVDLTGLDARRAEAKARRAVRDGEVDTLVVAGGDGAVGLGVNICAETEVPLGVVAVGTGNDNARELGLPVRDVEAAVERVLHGSARAVDLGRVRSTDASQQRWYLGVLCGGFDALVNERANTMRWPRGPARYNLAIARELPTFAPIPYTLTLDGEVSHPRAMLVCVGNGRAYGGGMRVTPDADMADGLLDVLVVDEISVPELLRVFPKVFRGAHLGHPAVSVHRARSVRLDAPGVVAYADGERLYPLPVDVDVVPGAVRILI